VTANSTEEALRRLEYIAGQGSRYIMYDFLTAGFAASADIFKRAGELGVIVHCHRAMHAIFTRQENHGVHMRVVAKWLRLVGGDHLHTGTVVGKLEGSREETLGTDDYHKYDRQERATRGITPLNLPLRSPPSAGSSRPISSRQNRKRAEIVWRRKMGVRYLRPRNFSAAADSGGSNDSYRPPSAPLLLL
jgi:hypothetical protein